MLDDENPSSIELTIPQRDIEISREILNILNWIPDTDPNLWEKRHALTKLNNMIQSKIVTLQKERNHAIEELTHRLRNREEHIRNLEDVLREMQMSFCREVDKNNALKKGRHISFSRKNLMTYSAEMFTEKYADILAPAMPQQSLMRSESDTREKVAFMARILLFVITLQCIGSYYERPRRSAFGVNRNNEC